MRAVSRFLAAQWAAFAASHEPDETAALVTPTALVAPVLVAAGYLILGYVPALAARSHFRLPWLAAALILLAVAGSAVVWVRRARGALGTFACLFDTFCYVAGLSLPVALTQGPYPIGFALGTGFFLIFFPARTYGFSPLLAIPMLVPPLVVVFVVGTDHTAGALLCLECAFAFVLSVRTRQRRRLQRQNQALQAALGAADQVAEASVEVALATAALDLGHTLHELRNCGAALSLNLDYVRTHGQLQGQALQALDEAIAARGEEDRLVARLLESVRRSSRRSTGTFVVQEVVRRSAAGATGLAVEVTDDAPPFAVPGNPEPLRLALLNLARNAQQAGATRLTITIRPDEPGRLVLAITDNGPGLSPAAAKAAFRPFAPTHPAGTGLGLYLCRRSIELLGGRIEIDPAAPGGATFRVVLTGADVAATPVARPAPADGAAAAPL